MRTVDEYIECLPENKQELCALLRSLVLDNVPGIQEKLSFKIPFYHYYGMFMYLNNTNEGIDVGFCRGKDILSEFPQLEMKNRAIVATVEIRSRKDIAVKKLREIIVAAAAWNKEAKKLNIPMIKKEKKK